MEKSEVSVGMRLTIISMTKTESEGWANGSSKLYLGRSGIVKEKHGEVPAIKLEFNYSQEVGSRWECQHWYHVGDLAEIEKRKVEEVTFDLKNLVVGV
jgi:hypothetical protein